MTSPQSIKVSQSVGAMILAHVGAHPAPSASSSALNIIGLHTDTLVPNPDLNIMFCNVLNSRGHDPTHLADSSLFYTLPALQI
jgi:hypothetical protein